VLSTDPPVNVLNLLTAPSDNKMESLVNTHDKIIFANNNYNTTKQRFLYRAIKKQYSSVLNAYIWCYAALTLNNWVSLNM